MYYSERRSSVPRLYATAAVRVRVPRRHHVDDWPPFLSTTLLDLSASVIDLVNTNNRRLYAWFPYVRIFRSAQQFCRHAVGTCGGCGIYSTFLVASGTPAARRWLPQTLALPTSFATILSNGKRSRCIALQAYVRSDGNHALGLPSV